MKLARLAALADAGPAAFISLQKPMPADDRAVLSLFPGMTDIADELTDFGETAAVMENLDLIITVDTAMGHLAGALARPVWILIPKAADWRWLLERTHSPWYPTARLFRQDEPGAWDAAILRLRDALVEDLASSIKPPISAADRSRRSRAKTAPAPLNAIA